MNRGDCITFACVEKLCYFGDTLNGKDGVDFSVLNNEDLADLAMVVRAGCALKKFHGHARTCRTLQ